MRQARLDWPLPFRLAAGRLLRVLRGRGENDTRRLALRLVDEAGIGLAPGTAFGAAWQGYLRLCFARNAEQLKTAMQRLVTNLTARS